MFIKFQSLLLLAVPLTCTAMLRAAELEITLPVTDTVTLSKTITISGNGGSNGAQVQVREVNGASADTVVTDGAWTVPAFQLKKGTNLIDITLSDKRRRILVVQSSGIERRKSQRVRFRWNEGVDEQIRQIALQTREEKATDDELRAYVTAVKARTAEISIEHYSGVDIHLISDDGDDVTTVEFLKLGGDLYGETTMDCGNKSARQTARVYVGAYRYLMAKDLSRWKPLQKKDSLPTRGEDLARALGRTAAHEVGHSLGLTGESGPCAWMEGCDGNHNCDATDKKYPEANRFDQGWFLLDPGPKTLNRARVAEPNRDERSNPRHPAVFEVFGKSYLEIILPTN